jgi:hypothetical protein
MNMQTDKETDAGLPSSNFTVAAVQRRVFTRSNLGMIFVNRNDFYSGKDTTAYNRVLGFDFNLASANGKWTGKTFYHQSFMPKQSKRRICCSISYQL